MIMQKFKIFYSFFINLTYVNRQISENLMTLNKILSIIIYLLRILKTDHYNNYDYDYYLFIYNAFFILKIFLFYIY